VKAVIDNASKIAIQIENQVTATFRIVTPMFLGGANHEADEIRPSSVKGILRFWWRATNWSYYQKNATDEANALRKLHDEEARLFGSAANDGKGGQGVFLLSVRSDGIKIGKPDINQFSPLHYMAGQGVVFQKDASKDRNALLSGKFSVNLRFRDSTSNDQRYSIVKALQVFGLVGGMGSRVRRGFGSVALLEIKGLSGNIWPQTVADYQKTLRSLFDGESKQVPPFTAFSSQGKVMFTQEVSDPIKVIELIGKEMALYRSYGKDGKVFATKKFTGYDSERTFIGDHDEMQNAAQGKAVTTAPKRLIFGIPHNYFFSSVKKSAQIQKTSGKLERRASPLMVHIHPIGNQYIGVILLMRSTFLPQGEKVLIGRSEIPVQEDWGVIEHFMQRPAFTEGAKV
jgi:CRISPR-associated protein Cmr1